MLKKFTTFAALLLLAWTSTNVLASHTVRGYYKKNGTYVSPHKSMDPGESKSSGYSYKNNELVPRRENTSSSTYNGF